MSFKSTYFRVNWTFCLLFVLTVGTFADTIRLKDGSIVKGRIVSFGGGKFVVALGDDQRRKELSFMAAEIESIQFEHSLSRTTISPVMTQPISKVAYSQQPVPSRPSAKAVTSNTNSRPVQAEPQVTRPQPNVDGVKSVNTNSSKIKPIEISVTVLGDNTANGWTNSGWVLKKGQKIRISGNGEVSLGGGKTTGPSGDLDLDDSGKLLKGVPTGALIAVVGDDNNDFIYVGSSREFTATRDGALFLGVNEGNLSDNSGSYKVKIEVDPGVGG